MIQSQFLQVIKLADGYVVYHSLFGQPLFINQEAHDFLMTFFVARYKKMTPDEKEVAQEFQELKFIVEDDFDDRKLLELMNEKYERDIESGTLINNLSLINSEVCNFACTYCIAEGAINDHIKKCPEKLMPLDTAKRAIDEYVKLIQKNHHPEALVNFGGGEPLLNFATLKSTVEYCKREYPNQDFRFTLNTNSSLINQQIAEFLCLHNFQIASSLDGTEDWNNKVRVYKDSNIKEGTYTSIMSGITQLRTASNNINGISITITDVNWPGINEDLIDWFYQNGFLDIRLDLDVLHCYGSLDPEEVARKLVSLKRYGKKYDMYISGFWERPLENMMPSVLESQTSFCGGKRGNSMCVSPSGDIYLCGYSKTKIGNVFNEMIPNETYNTLIKQQLPGKKVRCQGCSIEGQCIGGCYITEEIPSVENDSALEFNCKLYKAATFELLNDQVATE